MINFIIKISNKNQQDKPIYQFVKSPTFIKNISFGNDNLFLWGDPIFPNNPINENIAQWDINKLLKTIKGHYYFLKTNIEKNTINAGVSLFNILPLYYYEKEGIIILSSDSQLIASQLSEVYINKRFILETILFNYSLFNQSSFKEIFLLPTNHFLQVDTKGIKLQKHTSIEDYFISNPHPWKKAAIQLADIFIESSKQYFPDEPFAMSLTGGFDGRTLVSCGLHYEKTFSTYAFGSEQSKDVLIAKMLSRKANLEFNSITLDEQYIKNESLSNGLDFIMGASGGASFVRAHYLYAAKQLAKNNKFVITGNFGSEIFRAVHIAGIVTNRNLYNLFFAKNYENAIERLSYSQEFDWLNRLDFREEWEALKEDLKMLPCFNPYYRDLSKNEQFYVIVFEEVFRKYFGAEMVNQYKYLINRTPFLDFDFLKRVLETEMAGVYSDFFTHNPFKRFKGQILYAHIIQKTHPNFLVEMTDKGYRPNDLLSIYGNMKIGFTYLNKKKPFKRKQIEKDPYSVTTAFKQNKDFWHNIEFNTDLFKIKKFTNSFNESMNNKDTFYIALSQTYWGCHFKDKIDV